MVDMVDADLAAKGRRERVRISAGITRFELVLMRSPFMFHGRTPG
jgi:hypothetical protein